MTQTTVLAAPEPAVIRDELAELVIADLHGPIGGEDELLPGRPNDRYVLGRLAPNGEMVAPEQQDRLAEADVSGAEPDDTEPEAPNLPSMFPSAYGLTIRVRGDVDRLVAGVRAARYLPASPPEDAEDSGSRPRTWRRREPVNGHCAVPLRVGQLGPWSPCAELPDLVVRGRARRYDDAWLVTLFVVNAQQGDANRAEKWLFQVELSVTGPGDEAVIERRNVPITGGDEADRAERRRLAMAHRFSPEFAVGHGTAVHAEADPEDPMRALGVRTAAVPGYELPHTDVPGPETDPDLPELAGLELDMRALCELTGDALRTALLPLVTGYRAWLDRAEASIGDPDSRLAEYTADARETITAARRAADRIEHGIDLVTGGDARAARAFGFANAAMWSQRVHTLAARYRRTPDEQPLDAVVTGADRPANRSWRPFQLAFVLLNLPSLTDPGHLERGADTVADLLWFPTGGGKTEAYLGLTAYTLAIRRLQGDTHGPDATEGVAVLMRYTLRLLTIQQFQRAAALICACEVLRRADPGRWGTTPFRIGLWVGGQVTPNRTEQAEEWLKQARRARGWAGRGGGSPHQLTACPWCGSPIEPGRDIAVNRVTSRTTIVCPDLSCDFGAFTADPEGLPVLVVDQEIYRLAPALVIATVDKFAQLPWQGETQALFGRSRLYCERHGYLAGDLHKRICEEASTHRAEGAHPAATVRPANPIRPPDLIIQDELHLISGPLGSLVGLYETAVDKLASWELPGGRTVRPKVVASTATVRRANRQIGALFDRAHTEVFPPPGLRMRDSFFARQRDVARAPGRRYVGICAHGVRMKSTLIRVYVAVLGAAQHLHDRYGRNEVTDPYMTLVGYFNSLRDLGGMRRLVEDDVSTRLDHADHPGLARRPQPKLRELTSRMGSDEIPRVLDELELRFGGGGSGGGASNGGSGPRPIDVLLATNMISVGVDVSRLGVMVVANQPKSTAEYIQASSRVGRVAPGLVFTVFNWARPRDLSHYERFEHVHATLYRHVEALSVTPFADRAVDRGLTGLTVALVRNLADTYNPNLAARSFDQHSQLADHVVGVIKRRARDVLGDMRAATRIEDQIRVRLDLWSRERAKPARRLAYRAPRSSSDIVGLLHEPDGDRWQRTTCPTSLRDVEPGIRLVLLPSGADDRGPEPPFEPVPAAADTPPDPPSGHSEQAHGTDGSPT